MATHIISVENITELKKLKAEADSIIITLGQSIKGDNKGALYYYDPTDETTPNDTVYYNTVTSNVISGRWKKVFTRMINLPHGSLVMNAGKKEFYCNKTAAGAQLTTNSSSEATIYLTMDGTANGIAIFSEIWYDDSKATVNTTTANDAVSSCRKTLSADLKTLTHLFYKGNSSVISVLGANLLGFRGSGAGVPVQFIVEGI